MSGTDLEAALGSHARDLRLGEKVEPCGGPGSQFSALRT